MIKVGLTSDHHFFHDNIIRYCNRPYVDLYDMHEKMISSWNSIIKPDMIAIHMGDLFCGGNSEQMVEIISRLNGFKIIITGNHDRKGLQWLVDHGFERAFKHRWIVGDYVFSHRPQDPQYLVENKIRKNFHGHSHKHHYGHPYTNVCVDVNDYMPVLYNLALEEGDLKFKAGKSEPEISWL